MPPETNVASFVLRFVQETTDTDIVSPSKWRGVIKHVQTNEERHFTRFAEAAAFIARYVNLDEFSETKGATQHPRDLQTSYPE